MASRNYKILCVDDEEDILEILSYNLKREGYKVYTTNNGFDAIELAKEKIPDMIILDVMMPELDGMETCARLNEIPSLKNTIKIFLTARSEDYSQIAGFKSGADDYVTKPVKPKVLLHRIEALLRRREYAAHSQTGENIELAGLFIDNERYKVHRNGKEISLPKKEFELLSLLASKPGKVFKREEILRRVWGDDVVVIDRTIDVHIRKLREKLELKEIKTVKGVGYKFDTE